MWGVGESGGRVARHPSSSSTFWGQEVPQDLRSPERTPPSEEDSAEAERLKTEGETRRSHRRRAPHPPGLRGWRGRAGTRGGGSCSGEPCVKTRAAHSSGRRGPPSARGEDVRRAGPARMARGDVAGPVVTVEGILTVPSGHTGHVARPLPSQVWAQEKCAVSTAAKR